MTPALASRRVAVLCVALVVVGLLISSWVITSGLRDRASRSSRRVQDVAGAVASLSRLQSAENHYFDSAAPAGTVDFSTLIGRVLRAADRVDDPGANALLATYLSRADRVVRLIAARDQAAAARVEGGAQEPAGDLLINAYESFEAREAASAASTDASAADLTQAVQWGALALLVLALLTFWWLDARTERERSRAVARTEARYRGIVARGSDALFLLDAAGAVTFASEAARAVLGRDVDDAAAPTLASLLPEDDRPRLAAALAAARSDPGHAATLPVALDGPEPRFLEVVVNDRLADPSIGAVVVSARDLTARRAAESALARSEALTQDLIDHTPVLVYVRDLAGRYQRVNRAWADAMGRTAAGSVGRTVDELFDPSVAAVLRAADEAVLTRGAYEAEQVFEVGGANRTLLTSRFPLVDAAGEVYAVGGVSIDVTDRARQVESERTLGSLMTHSGDAIFTTSLGAISFVNPAAEALMGYPAPELIGATPTVFAAPGHEIEQARLWAAVRRGETVQGASTSIRTKSGGVIPVEVTLTPQRDEAGDVIGVSGIVRDVTARRRESEELARDARTDHLTGLPNRKALLSHLARVTDRVRRNGETAALMFFDLDHFKAVNDTYKAHDAGNAVLKAMALRMRDAVRPTDFVARIHGDEFVAVCFPVEGRDGAEEIARRVADAIAEPIEFQGHALCSTASVGVALTPVDDADAWLARGDAAMYEAKNRGRDQVVLFEEWMPLVSPDRSTYPHGLDDDGPPDSVTS